MVNPKEHRNNNGIEEKHCYSCELWKPLDQYSICKSKWDKLTNRCRRCERKIKRKKVFDFTHKTCEICEQSKETLDFNLNRHTSDGLKYLCVECEELPGENEKYCSSCKVILPFDKFAKKTGRGCGRHAMCTKCVYKSKGNKYDEYNKKYQTKYRKENKEQLKNHAAEYYQANKQEIHRRVVIYRKENPQAQLAANLRSRIRYAIKSYNDPLIQKVSNSLELINCSLPFLKKWLEFQFDSNMTWDNYGSYWHIDHVVPCEVFDLKIARQQKICFHWTNLQPLEKKENIAKSNKVLPDHLFRQELRFYAFRNLYIHSTNKKPPKLNAIKAYLAMS